MFNEKPRTLEVCETGVPIDTDFRIMCEFAEAVRSKDSDKLAETAQKFYYAGLPENAGTDDAAKGMSRFYGTGIDPKGAEKGAENGAEKDKAPVFDFEQDEVYFYAAFLSAYSIDLNTAKLHWFDFCALFRGLPDECRLKQIIGIRAADLRKISSPAEKKRIRELKKLYALDGAEQESEAVRLLRERAMKEREENARAGTVTD